MDTSRIKSLFRKVTCIGFFGATVLLSACGGGGSGGSSYTGLTYSGNSDPAGIDANNAEQIGTTTSNAVTTTVNNENSNNNPFAVAVSGQAPLTARQTLNNIFKQIINETTVATALPVGVTYTSGDLNDMSNSNVFCGGYMTGPSLSATSGTLTFYDLCFDIYENGSELIYLNGTMSFQETTNGNLETTTTSYTNFSMTVSGETYTISGTQRCTFNTDTWEETCADLYTGADGKVYQIEDASVLGDNTGGYYISATVYHPTFGSVEISTYNDPITICPNGHPGSGTISFTGSNGSYGSINFTDCNNYTVSYNDGAGGASSISGTW